MHGRKNTTSRGRLREEVTICKDNIHKPVICISYFTYPGIQFYAQDQDWNLYMGKEYFNVSLHKASSYIATSSIAKEGQKSMFCPLRRLLDARIRIEYVCAAR